MEQLKSFSTKFPILAELERRTNGNIKREYAMVGLIFLVIAMVILSPIGSLVTSCVTLAVPIKETLTMMKQVKKKDEEIKHACVFWMTYSLLMFVDAYLKFILGFIPFYGIAKLAILMWLGPVKLGGGIKVYDCLISKIPVSWYSYDIPIEEVVRKVSSEVNKNKDLLKSVEDIEKKRKPKEE